MATSVKRPVNLQLGADHRAQRLGPGRPRRQAAKTGAPSPSSPQLAAAGGQRSSRLPSLVLPHLYLGAIDQTNRDTLNKLNISYILSLGLLPLVGEQASSSPTSPSLFQHQSVVATPSRRPRQHQHQHQLQTHLPSSGCSRDFRIRLRCLSASGRGTPVDSSLQLERQTPITTPNSAKTLLEPAEQTTPTPPTPPPLTTTITTITTNNNLNNENHRGALRLIKCKCINVPDNCEASLASFFDETNQFIEEARRKKCNILVHCRAGISRSATVAIAYVMRSRSVAMRDAYKLVKLTRPQIDPNLGFIGQLIAYEKVVLADQANNNNNNNNNNDNKPIHHELAQGHTSSSPTQILGG